MVLHWHATCAWYSTCVQLLQICIQAGPRMSFHSKNSFRCIVLAWPKLLLNLLFLLLPQFLAPLHYSSNFYHLFSFSFYLFYAFLPDSNDDADWDSEVNVLIMTVNSTDNSHNLHMDFNDASTCQKFIWADLGIDPTCFP